MSRLLIVGFAVAVGCFAGSWPKVSQAQDELSQDPGYVDFASIEQWFDADPWLEINMKGALLRLVAEASRYDDPDLAELLHKLKAIQVRGYPLRRSGYRDVEARTEAFAGELERRGWDVVVRVRDRDERVDMFTKVVDGSIAGLVVMVLEPGDDETVFVNIVGEIDPGEIGRIGSKFNIGPLKDAQTRSR